MALANGVCESSRHPPSRSCAPHRMDDRPPIQHRSRSLWRHALQCLARSGHRRPSNNRRSLRPRSRSHFAADCKAGFVPLGACPEYRRITSRSFRSPTGSGVISRLPKNIFVALSNALAASGGRKSPDTSATNWPAQITIGYAQSLRHSGFSANALQHSLNAFQHESPVARKEAARLAQLALGDVGPGKHAPVFDGYASPLDLAPYSDELQPLLGTVRDALPCGDSGLDTELGRLLAIVQPSDSLFLDKALAQITAESSPVDDVHWLIVAARLPAPAPTSSFLRSQRPCCRSTARSQSDISLATPTGTTASPRCSPP